MDISCTAFQRANTQNYQAKCFLLSTSSVFVRPWLLGMPSSTVAGVEQPSGEHRKCKVQSCCSECSRARFTIATASSFAAHTDATCIHHHYHHMLSLDDPLRPAPFRCADCSMPFLLCNGCTNIYIRSFVHRPRRSFWYAVDAIGPIPFGVSLFARLGRLCF